MHQLVIDELKAFIGEAHQHGYAAKHEENRVKGVDGSTSIYYGRGLWTYHDNFFGGEPYGGREVVSFEGKPLWMMVYYGSVKDGVDPKIVYPVLCRSLLADQKENPSWLPLRGPTAFLDIESGWCYYNEWSGELSGFKGKEYIMIGDETEKVYSAEFIGGLVDQRRGD